MNKIAHENILPMEVYGKSRLERRGKISVIKKNRRLHIGPDAVFHFENYDTIFHQIHEMLWIEKGGASQVDDELLAYNPLIPNGNELVATLMFEIEDPVRRATVLAGLGGVENTVFIGFDGKKSILGQAEDDLDRTSASGKASSVQFLHFEFSKDQIDIFKNMNTQVTVGIEHKNYGHISVMPPQIRESLCHDFN